jgi:hypothetical protein
MEFLFFFVTQSDLKVLCFEYDCRQTVFFFAKDSLQAFLCLKSIPLMQNIG